MKFRWVFAGLLVLFVFLRLVNLTVLPIFNDESTYLRYGLHQLHEPDHNPYSLLIGKEPLLPFLYAVAGSLAGDLLLGARIVTVVFGLLTVLGLYMVSVEILKRAQNDKHSRWVGVLSCLLYVIAPYTVFFDRLALLDSPVSTVAVWTLYFTCKLIESIQTSPRPSLMRRGGYFWGLLLGVVMGAGMWIKFSALMYIALPLMVFVYYGYKQFALIAEDNNSLKLALPFTLAFFIFLPLVSHPMYTEHWLLLEQYTYPVISIFQFPLSVWWENFVRVSFWLFFYLTPPVFLMGLGVLRKLRKLKMGVVGVWLVLPFVYEVFYAKLFTSRQALSLTIPLFVLAGYGCWLLIRKNKLVGYGVLSVIVAGSLFMNSILLTNPRDFPALFYGAAKTDLEGYVVGFSSGYGVKEAVDYLQDKAKDQPITVVIRNDHGNPEDAIVAYLNYKENIKVVALNDPAEQIGEVLEKAGTPVYSVSRGGFYAGLENYFVDEKKFEKPDDVEFVGVQLLQDP